MPSTQQLRSDQVLVFRIGGGPRAPNSALPIGAVSATDPLRVSHVAGSAVSGLSGAEGLVCERVCVCACVCARACEFASIHVRGRACLRSSTCSCCTKLAGPAKSRCQGFRVEG